MKLKEEYSTGPSKQIFDDYKAYFKEKSVKIPRILIHGGYGKKNVGDEAILTVMIDRIRKPIPNSEITVLSYNPVETRSQYGVKSYNFVSLKAFFSILKSHLILIGGGGIVNKINVYSGFSKFKIFDAKGKYILLNALFSKLFGKKVIFYVVGTTSIPDPLVKLLLRASVNRCDKIFVRDPLSKTILKNIGVKKEIEVTYDPVVELGYIDAENARELLIKEGIAPDRFLVGLSLRYVGDEELNKNTLREASLIIGWLIEDFHALVVFLPMCKHPFKHLENDLDLAEELYSLIMHKKSFKILKNEYTPQEMKGIFGQMDFCILTRLHSVIMASLMDAPFICISYDNKVTQFVKMIDKEDWLLPYFGSFSFANITEKIEYILNKINR